MKIYFKIYLVLFSKLLDHIDVCLAHENIELAYASLFLILDLKYANTISYSLVEALSCNFSDATFSAHDHD